MGARYVQLSAHKGNPRSPLLNQMLSDLVEPGDIVRSHRKAFPRIANSYKRYVRRAQYAWALVFTRFP